MKKLSKLSDKEFDKHVFGKRRFGIKAMTDLERRIKLRRK